MSARVFNGRDFSKDHEQILKDKIKLLSFTPRMASVVFHEDDSSQIYTRLKMEAAVRVGIEFDRVDLSITEQEAEIVGQIRHLSNRQDLYGIMIQKPTKKIIRGKVRNFSDWWELLTGAIDPQKDVDCLTRTNLDSVYRGESVFIPATARAVLHILDTALTSSIRNQKIAIVGRSELVGRPLHYIFEKSGAQSYLLGSKDDLKAVTTKADIIISATGVPSLIKADMIKSGSIIIDVGEPKGDVDFESVKAKVSFITPVPDGVGPVTVVSLLENLFSLVAN